MTALLLFIAWSVATCSAAFLLGACLSHCDAQEQSSAPDGTAGDLLADEPVDVIVPVVPDYVPRTWTA